MVVDERNKTLFVCVYQMPVMLIRIHGIIIMIYMIFWGYHIRNNQTKKIGSGTFAVCKNHGTWQKCQSLPCAKTMAHGKDLNFAMCHASRAHGKGMATSSFLGGNFFCRGSIVAHGKPFAVCPIYSTWQRLALPIPGCRVRFAVGFWGFTVCPWHTAKGVLP